jgi:hypothetical protein
MLIFNKWLENKINKTIPFNTIDTVLGTINIAQKNDFDNINKNHSEEII